MTRYNGGNEVKGGTYWNVKSWEVSTVGGDRGRLPGYPTARFVRVPFLALLVLAPAMGGLFAIFLPFIGFAMAIYAIGAGLARRTHGARLARLTHGARRPSRPAEVATSQ